VRALSEFEKATELDPGYAQAWAGIDGTLRWIEGFEMPWIRLPGVAMAQHALGHPRESKAALEVLIAAHAGDSAYQIAEVHAWRGETDKAFEWLERARVQADTGLGWIKVAPLLTPIRSDARYGALLRKLNLPADEK
jgi:hypothetical protein